MRCDLAIPVECGMTLIITEFLHSPEQKLTFDHEYLPEYFEVTDGYLTGPDGRYMPRMKFWMAYNRNEAKVLERIKEWFYTGGIEDEAQ